MNRSLTAVRLFVTVVLLALLAACAQTPKITPEQKKAQAEFQALKQNARALATAGQFRQAAEAYRELAEKASGTEKHRFRLLSADNWIQAGETALAQDTMQQVEDVALSKDMQTLARLVRGEIQLERNLPEEALNSLAGPMPGAEAPAWRIRWLTARAEAHQATGNRLETARVRSELDLLLTVPEARLDNQRQLLEQLSGMTDEALRRYQAPPPNLFGGWMALADALRQEELAQSLDQWRAGRPGHPAMRELLDGFLAGIEDSLLTYGKVAVLLPASGRYAAAGQALRAGLMSSFYAADEAQRPVLLFYDTSDAGDIWPLYQQAVSDGAGAIIGPLQKSAVEQLARAGELAIPVLALNRISLDTPPPTQLYQFGLAPEDEAAQAALRARRSGASHALALVPDSAWGKRLLTAFSDRFEEQGGRMAEHQFYDPSTPDFSAPIQALLNLDDSEARYQTLAGRLGQNMEFEPAPRGDTQVVFLAANADKARQLWPQLQFNRVAGMQVFATSDIYSGRFTTPRDLDLIGLEFSAMPWLLAQEAGEEQQLPESVPKEGPLARLFAMGMDSYHLLAALQRLQRLPGATLAGATGKLALAPLNQVDRTLDWARMTPTGPQLLPEIEVIAEQTDVPQE